MRTFNWRRLWVARPTSEQQAAHDRTGVRGTVETSDGLTLNTAAELLRYLRAVPQRDVFDAIEERLNAELVKAYKRIGDLEAENDRLRYGKATG